MPIRNSQTRSPFAKVRLNEAVNKLSKYFGLYTVKDLAGRIALTEIQGMQNQSSFDFPRPSPELTRIIELMIDTSTGAYTTKNLISLLNRAMTQATNDNNAANIQKVNSLIKIFYAAGDGSGNNNAGEGDLVLKGSSNGPHDDIASIIHSTDSINSNITNPNRRNSPGLSVIMQNSIRATPSQKNTNACTIFLNGVPTIELARSVPFLDVQFQFGRPPTDINNRIQNASIEKFLQGAVVATAGSATDGGNNRSIVRLMLDANVVSGSNNAGNSDNVYSTAGMELFTSPMTLVNADEVDNPLLRSAPVLDKFRPFLTFKDLTIEVRPSGGLMSYKSATMTFVLHDRSRLAEIADFIRPDLYSATEILIEYGWSHPDSPEERNSYADLINGMRCKEKYSVINSSFGMDDVGQINVTLQLAMRGTSDMDTENIASDGSDNIGRSLQAIARLSRTVGELRRRTFQQGAPGSREIRGIQILDAATDSNGQIGLSRELITSLHQFRNQMTSAGHTTPDVSSLISQLDNLYGTDGNGGQAAQLRNTVQRSIADKLVHISEADPFKSEGGCGNRLITARVGGRQLGPSARQRGGGSAQDPNLRNLAANTTVTLAKLLLIFIGAPLAHTSKYDDVQLIFYPFNQYAAFASTINIGQFEVDIRYFYQQYSRYRTESASRAGNVSLRDFLTFIAATVIDDPAAPSYGLRDNNGAFYRVVRDSTTHQEVLTTQTSDRNAHEIDSVALQLRTENLLRSVTPDGTFKMPVIDFYIECVPEAREAAGDGEAVEGSDNKSILRIHVYDKQTSCYDTQAALLQANRDEELRTIGNLPTRTGGDPGVRQEQDEAANTIITAARDSGLIEEDPQSNKSGPGGSRIYRIVGGPRRLKEFIMKTSPYIIYGTAGTAVTTAGVATIQDAANSTVALLRSYHTGPLIPNGESPGGLPLQVIPAEMSMQTIGCPLLEFAQQFFVDFQTGTTLDNYYNITGLSHKFEPGNYSTSIKFSFGDAWGKYSSLTDKVRTASEMLTGIQNRLDTGASNGGPSAPGQQAAHRSAGTPSNGGATVHQTRTPTTPATNNNGVIVDPALRAQVGLL